jgi:hypothetical protein
MRSFRIDVVGLAPRVRHTGLLILPLLVGPLSCADSTSQTPQDDERAVLLVVAPHVRTMIDGALRSYLGVARPSEYEVRVLPEDFPVPGALEAVTERIGNATAGPMQQDCGEPGSPCTYTPDVGAATIFSELHLVTADSATLYVEVLIPPQGGRTDGYAQTHRAFVVRRAGGWEFVGSRVVEES